MLCQTRELVGKRGHRRAPERHKGGGAAPSNKKERKEGGTLQSYEEDCQAKEPGGTPSTKLGASSRLPGVGGGGAMMTGGACIRAPK